MGGGVAGWEQILFVVLAGGLLFFMWPKLRASMKRERQAEKGEWGNLLFIIGLVVLFVLFLIFSVQ